MPKCEKFPPIERKKAESRRGEHEAQTIKSKGNPATANRTPQGVMPKCEISPHRTKKSEPPPRRAEAQAIKTKGTPRHGEQKPTGGGPPEGGIFLPHG